MTKKTRLTYEEHLEMGRELYRLRNELMELGIRIRNAYPKADRAVKKIQTTQDAIDQTRAVMDSHLAKEHPERFDTKVYYPGSADDRA
ncbi:hypothetical protein [Streptomyces lavendofoliae]|uniref:Uncharacterized protein n=1 Tax=Streptomyces lavendofoliae TaxID=67314 RepID=A0A918M7U4_9ACTN|nr:hypothetical protein [Streptomyces lavendofoliae]GGU62657.1 hypothetical protein GCM10010274_59330 [Streptomyces lavendofoliae]